MEPADSDSDLNDDVPMTVSKRKRRGQTSATIALRHKRIRNLAMPTPYSMAALRARRRKAPLFAKPPPPRIDEYYKKLQKLPKDPWLGDHIFHLAARPNELSCWGGEYTRVLMSVLGLVEEGGGGYLCESELAPPGFDILIVVQISLVSLVQERLQRFTSWFVG